MYAQNDCSIDITNSWLEHNVSRAYYNQSINGMEIHCEIEAENMRGKSFYVIVFFAYIYDGEYIMLRSRSGNSQFRTRDGSVAVWEKAYAKYDSTYWEDFVLYIPYYELAKAISEDSEMVCVIQIQSQSGDTYATSEDMFFDFNF